MEQNIINQIPWSSNKPTSEGFYLFLDKFETTRVYPEIDFVYVCWEQDVLIADSDNWRTFFEINDPELNGGYWARVEIKNELKQEE